MFSTALAVMKFFASFGGSDATSASHSALVGTFGLCVSTYLKGSAEAWVMAPASAQGRPPPPVFFFSICEGGTALPSLPIVAAFFV